MFGGQVSVPTMLEAKNGTTACFYP